jgi:hypothetical protein
MCRRETSPLVHLVQLLARGLGVGACGEDSEENNALGYRSF